MMMMVVMMMTMMKMLMVKVELVSSVHLQLQLKYLALPDGTQHVPILPALLVPGGQNGNWLVPGGEKW